MPSEDEDAAEDALAELDAPLADADADALADAVLDEADGVMLLLAFAPEPEQPPANASAATILVVAMPCMSTRAEN